MRAVLPRAFRWFWAAETVSGFGAWITFLALQVIIVEHLHAGAIGLGWLGAARWLPYLLFGLVLGALIDRVRRRPVMIASDLMRACLLCLIPLLWWSGHLSLPILLLLVAVLGTATLINDSASQAFVPRLIPSAALQSAHARIDGTNAAAETAGPALGDGDRKLLREIGAGLRWVYANRSLRDLAIWTHVWFAAQAILLTVAADYILSDIGLDAFWFGIIVAGSGLGGIIGAVATRPVGLRLGYGRTVILAHAISTVGVLVLLAAMPVHQAGQVGQAPQLTAVSVLFLGQLLHGFAIGLSNSREMAYRQSITPDAFQARTNTTMRSTDRAVIVVFSPVAGVVTAAAGAQFALTAAVCIFGLTAIGLWFSAFRTVRLGED
ncbi:MULTISPECIES: MFS transporter [unclassified Brevibacterium]|uniref:MFS transporter n=1 Tax=unclassified Brevibacterium TaxID=2614124 RepID=UPI001E440B8C|nr:MULTISPECIES: MFS transporter [unclassified Brevibacterium]MDK8436241.1 MFS transporter [Brevibacterium sp. H-BE7]